MYCYSCPTLCHFCPWSRAPQRPPSPPDERSKSFVLAVHRLSSMVEDCGLLGGRKEKRGIQMIYWTYSRRRGVGEKGREGSSTFSRQRVSQCNSKVSNLQFKVKVG